MALAMAWEERHLLRREVCGDIWNFFLQLLNSEILDSSIQLLRSKGDHKLATRPGHLPFDYALKCLSLFCSLK